jgi:hypothetical protein
MSPVALLYPSMGLVVDEHLEVTLSDPARIGQPRQGDPGRVLLVVGGSTADAHRGLVAWRRLGETDPRTGLEAWASGLAEHGYLAAAIAHTPRTDIGLAPIPG